MSHRRTIAVLVALTMVVGLVPFIPAPLGPAPAAAQTTEPDLPTGCSATASPVAWIGSVASTSSSITVTLADPLPAATGANMAIYLCYPNPDTPSQYTSGDGHRYGSPGPSAGAVAEITRLGHQHSTHSLSPGTDYWVLVANEGAGTRSAWTYIRTKAAARVLVSNIGQQEGAGSSLASFDQAQGFTTGANADGYTLASVEANFGGGLSGVSVKVATGLPSTTTVVATLTNPDSLSAGNLTFTAPEGTVLAANTTYYVVVEASGGTTITTNSDDEDSAGLSDWSVADKGHWRNASSTGAWTQPSENSLQIRINGVAKSPPPPGPPAKPAAPTVSKTDGTQITVSWTAPTANPAITGYSVQYRRINVPGTTEDAAWTDHTHTGTTTSATVTGLVRAPATRRGCAPPTPAATATGPIPARATPARPGSCRRPPTRMALPSPSCSPRPW